LFEHPFCYFSTFARRRNIEEISWKSVCHLNGNIGKGQRLSSANIIAPILAKQTASYAKKIWNV
jgi:hypothetical protein